MQDEVPVEEWDHQTAQLGRGQAGTKEDLDKMTPSAPPLDWIEARQKEVGSQITVAQSLARLRPAGARSGSQSNAIPFVRLPLPNCAVW
jgi:hypothetical protein